MGKRRLIVLALLGCGGWAQSAEPASGPPPGAKVLYRCDFEAGKTDGWSGELTRAHKRPGSQAALAVGPETGGASRTMKVPLTEETVLSFRVYTEDCPALIIQARNETHGYTCRSYCFLYSNVHYGRWTRVYWPLTRALVENNNNRKWPVAGDVLADLSIIKKKVGKQDPGRTVLLDDIVVFSLDGPGKVKQARAALKKLSAAAAAAKELPAPAKAAQRWPRQIEALESQAEKLAARKDLPYAEGKALYQKVEALAGVVERCRKYSPQAARAFGPGADFAVGTEHSMVRVSDLHWAYPFRGEMTGSVRLHAARHEYANFQAVVMPLTKDLKQVNVTFSDLTSPGGTGVIPAANCTWRRQPYVQLKPTFHYPGYDWLAPKPDPLLPGAPFDLPVERYKPLWITVYTPRDVPAGEYEGAMTVRCANAAPVSVKIRLRVWDYNIPFVGVFRGQTHFDLGNVGRFYKCKVTQELRRRWYAFILQYRFSPTAQYSTGLHPRPEDFEFCKARGCNLWMFGHGSFRSGLRERDVAREVDLARQAGVLEYTMAYISDEPGPKRFKEVTDMANACHVKFPGLKVMIGGSRPRKELVGYVDVWDPIMNYGGTYGFDPKEIRAALARGEQVMWYTAASPWHPYPNVQMGDPLYASRIIFWLTWKYRITGFEYYYWNLWADNMKTEPRWPQSPWDTHSFKSRFNPYNGDGMLCYPGPGGHPAASVRLENIRDGIEDWESLWVLTTAAEALTEQIRTGRVKPDKAIGVGTEKTQTPARRVLERARAAVAIGDSFCKDPITWTLDPKGLLARRVEAGELIEAIIGLIGKDRLEAFRKQKVVDRKALEAKRLEQNRRKALRETAEPAAETDPAKSK